MMRHVSIALVLVAATAGSAQAWANDVSAGASGHAVFQMSAMTGKAVPPVGWRERAVGLDMGGGLALVEPGLRAVAPMVGPDAGGSRTVRQRPGDPLAGLAAVRNPQNAVAGFDLGQSKPVVAYPVSASLTLGFGYRYVKGEDLVFRTVDAGSLRPEYDSHNVLLRARWRF